MKRFRLHILLFFISLFIPMTILIYRTYISLEQEETAALRFFADTIFNEIEEELSSLIIREELRSVDEYNLPDRYGNSETSQIKEKNNTDRTDTPYILGYLQNNPDGTYQSPFRLNKGMNENVSQAELDQVNTIFNEKKTYAPESFKLKSSVVAEPSGETESAAPPAPDKDTESFAGKYLDIARSKKQKSYLGKRETRVEEISRDQALNISQTQEILPEEEKENSPALEFQAKASPLPAMKQTDTSLSDEDSLEEGDLITSDLKLEVEIDPLQSVFIDDEKIFIFRRIVLNNSIFRQGFILDTHVFFTYLSDRFFISQPISGYTQLTISAHDSNRNVFNLNSGSPVSKTKFEMKRSFPRPFSFMTMSLKSDKIPASTGRKTINIMSLAILLISLAGFFTIYKSIKTMISLSERRSDFVSSVTHELKTPLTNIRMYIEMLEYGIAQNKERKRDYFRILNSESGRLSRLINNVLEFSKLEKKQRVFNLRTGSLQSVFNKLEDVLGEKIKQEGFRLLINNDPNIRFMYDQEAMLQIFINLIENSIKFGKSSQEKEISVLVQLSGNKIRIDVSDKGEGIPKGSLDKIFDDFYRADNSLTRTTGGTGIGLSLVKKYTEAMGGQVRAVNNIDAGCTISLFFKPYTAASDETESQT